MPLSMIWGGASAWITPSRPRLEGVFSGGDQHRNFAAVTWRRSDTSSPIRTFSRFSQPSSPLGWRDRRTKLPEFPARILGIYSYLLNHVSFLHLPNARGSELLNQYKPLLKLNINHSLTEYKPLQIGIIHARMFRVSAYSFVCARKHQQHSSSKHPAVEPAFLALRRNRAPWRSRARAAMPAAARQLRR